MQIIGEVAIPHENSYQIPNVASISQLRSSRYQQKSVVNEMYVIGFLCSSKRGPDVVASYC
jgi:hypothetical protein